MNTAHKGRRNEWKSRDYMRLLGYIVLRSAASKGTWDLVCRRGLKGTKGVVVYVQCKTNAWPTKAEFAAMAADECPGTHVKACHRWDDGKPRKPQIRIWDPQTGLWLGLDPSSLPELPKRPPRATSGKTQGRASE